MSGIVIVEVGQIEQREITRLKKRGIDVVLVKDASKARAFPMPSMPLPLQASASDGFRLDS
jgi:hypothetical protein